MSSRGSQVRYSFVIVKIAVFATLAFVCAQVAATAQTSSSSASAPAKSPVVKNRGGASSLDSGSLSAGAYRNSSFGFSCKIPTGWVLRTDEMNATNQEDGKEASGGNQPAEAGKQGRVLLAAFSRPPEARAEDVNASILIAAESVDKYPGLTDAAQYFGPVTEVTKAQGFAIVEEPYELEIGTKTLVRGDYEKDVGTRVMHQSTLVFLARGSAISFTFIAGTEDDVEDLVQGLSFSLPKSPR
jgi:hypothetical protein